MVMAGCPALLGCCCDYKLNTVEAKKGFKMKKWMGREEGWS